MTHSYIPTQSDFNRRGSLKTLTTFESCVSISSVTVRRRQKYEPAPESEAKSDSYYILLEDGYGAQWSYFRNGMSLEKAQEIAAKIPYGKTIFVSGEVAIRKGNTFFNATRFYWPDGSDLLLERTNEELVED